MSLRTPSPRPWYCNDELVEFYKLLARAGGRFGLSLKTLKLLKAGMTNFIVAGVAVYAMQAGGDPTMVGTSAVVALALLNGVELSEWLAAKQALKELDLENRDDR